MSMKTFKCHVRYLGVYHKGTVPAETEDEAWTRFLNLIKSGQTQTFKEDAYRKDRLYLFIEEVDNDVTVSVSSEKNALRSKVE